MKIYFVGYLKSPFIQQDFNLLNLFGETRVFDLSIHQPSLWQIPGYIIDSLMEWNNVREADVIWMWFADYPAVPFILLAKVFKKPVVLNVGGWEVYAAPDIGYGNQLNIIRGAVTRWILRNVRVCLTKSKAYEEIIHVVEPKANVEVHPGWVPLGITERPIHKKSGVVTAYCTFTFTYVLKGIPIFEAATVGMKAKVIKNIPYKDLLDEFLHAKVYCQLSRTESFGISLLEAMACGCVPVVSDRDALPEVVGDTGIVVPYGDVEKTREAILKAMDMDGSPARARAKLFSREMAQKRIQRMLGELWNH